VILGTIGTSAPFERLVSALNSLDGDETVLIQAGRTSTPSHRAKLVDFLPYDELARAVRTARVVVTHAGVGSILLTLSNNKRPVVIPRLRRYGEAIDDHQLEFGRRLADLGLVTLVEDLDRLPAALDGANHNIRSRPNGGGLADALRAYLVERIGPPASLES
jgi:beta-1,4-N-acetylglucosaminyltransferase